MIYIEALRNAISDWARSDSSTRPLGSGPAQREWDRADLNRALREQGINLDDEHLDIAFNVLRKRSFMGGNYTLDAKAVSAALGGGPR